MRRVVITGMGAVSPIGNSVDEMMAALEKGESGVTCAGEYASMGGLRSLVKAAVRDIDERSIPRKFRRSMSRMSILAALATREAWREAGLDQGTGSDSAIRTGVSMGSTLGSPHTFEKIFKEYLGSRSLEKIKATLFFQVMNHSVASNISQYLGLEGATYATSAACATGCQSVGLAYSLIRSGVQDKMVCGGADELHPMTTATFDIINAASTRYNDRPQMTPRPFDRERDGVVCAEGAGVLVLEELTTALGRGAGILAEVKGFATLSDNSSMADPDPAAMEKCMALALEDAGIEPGVVGYVNAHATGTERGDQAECAAIYNIFGERIPVSSLKGNMGHTMAASGALELIATVRMLSTGNLYPTRNLDNPAAECCGVDHIMELRRTEATTALKNSFAMGGVNCSMVIGRYVND